MKLQAVTAPKFQMFQDVAIKPAEPVMLNGELFVSPRAERGVIVGMFYSCESHAEFFGGAPGWDYMVDADFEMSLAEAATADERDEPDCFNEDDLTLIADVAVELIAA